MINRGIAVSPGVAVGKAYCIHEVYVDPDKTQLEPNEIQGEWARFEVARKKSIAEVRALQEKVRRQVSKDADAVFLAHESILNDHALTNRIRSAIHDERLPAQAALANLVEHYRKLLGQSSDEYLRERIDDIRDVVMRLTSHLSQAMKPNTKVLEGQLIVVADELLPSHVVMFGSRPVHGIVTQAGSQTSHAAIIARSRGIPAVSGASGILQQTKTGDTIVIDGREGLVLINPDAESLSAYRKLEREFFHLKDQLAHNRDRDARTADGVPIELLANINDIDGAKAAKAMGASGIGLYRTEYLYLAHKDVPDEEEQLNVYRKVLNAAPNHAVTIRTLDIGGDKTVPFLSRSQNEANPFLGWRSIRLSFEHPEFFMTQIRAILRVAAKAKSNSHVKLLFPMVTNLEEIRKLRSFVRRAQKQLESESIDVGQVDFGMMIEVPAAAMMIDDLVKDVDFVSIGSNDLVQYLMAADRDNPRVSHLCQPLSPAMLRVLENVIATCDAHQTPVTLCGEMAGQPAAFVALLGMGLRRFSMSPAFIPTIKDLASHVSISDAERIYAKIKRERTTARIKQILSRELLILAPNLQLLIGNA